MRPFYATARLLLAPSLWEETWGRVVTEAHVNAIPVLASNRGGLPETTGPGGILLSPDAPIALWHQALADIWDNPNRHAELSAVARTHATGTNLAPAVIAKTLINLLSRHIATQKDKAA
jgi:glycosyltransferase involved in cell wall biosynthesis